MGRIITEKEFPEIRARHKNQKIVFTSGTFDLLHAGHILFFEDCKKHGDILVVTTGRDEVIRRNKGEGRPILNEHERLKIVSSLEVVDYCAMERNLYEDSLKHLELIFKELQPDAYVVNEDAFNIPYRKQVSRDHGVELVILKRWHPPEFDGISTTNIIEKIKRLSSQ